MGKKMEATLSKLNCFGPFSCGKEIHNYVVRSGGERAIFSGGALER